MCSILAGPATLWTCYAISNTTPDCPEAAQTQREQCNAYNSWPKAHLHAQIPRKAACSTWDSTNACAMGLIAE